MWRRLLLKCFKINSDRQSYERVSGYPAAGEDASTNQHPIFELILLFAARDSTSYTRSPSFSLSLSLSFFPVVFLFFEFLVISTRMLYIGLFGCVGRYEWACPLLGSCCQPNTIYSYTQMYYV